MIILNLLDLKMLVLSRVDVLKKHLNVVTIKQFAHIGFNYEPVCVLKLCLKLFSDLN